MTRRSEVVDDIGRHVERIFHEHAQETDRRQLQGEAEPVVVTAA